MAHAIVQSAARQTSRVFGSMLCRDRDIRPVLRARLAADHAHDAGTRILDEMPICQARARADVAVVNGELAGFEIKSDVDRLDRLASQVRYYGRIFDRSVVVCAPRHLAVLRRRLPVWWGLWAIDETPAGSLALHVDRIADANPETNKRDRLALLRRDEMAEVFEHRIGGDSRRMRRMALMDALVVGLGPAEISAEVRRYLCARAA